MIFVLLGPPGVGKGTQARLLAQRHNLEAVSTGDMIRAEVALGTPLGLSARAYIDAGNLVPDDLILQMVEGRLQNRLAAGFLLDGFPRTVPQAEGLTALLARTGRQLRGVLQIVVPEERVVERLGHRRVCPECNRVYNLESQPSAVPGRCDDHPGVPLVLRSDDDPVTVRHRIRVYHQQTEPLVAWYRERGLLREIDGLGEVDDVAGRIEAALDGAVP